MKRSALRLSILGSLVGLSIATPAHADERQEARRHFRRGMELVVEGQLDAGIEELRAAYEILPHPNVLYNIARAYAENGRYPEAIEYFEEYLASGPQDAVEVRGFIAALRERESSRRPAVADGASGATPPATSTPAVDGTATDSTPATGGGTAVVPSGVTSEDATALRETAGRLDALAAVLGSPELIDRANRLRALAAALEASPTAPAGGGTSPTADGSSGGDQAAASGGDTVASGGDGASSTEGGDGATEPGGTGAGLDLGESQSGVYEEQFVSATRSAVDPLDAPNSTTIITRQDIRLTGITHIGELLRRVAGVQVMTTGPTETNVGMRGFNQRLSPRVLLLVNGRSTYIDPLGITLYQQNAASVEDIERIEVVRGPASALYGANGFSGIVNVITRTPGAEPGTEATVSVGNAGQLRGYLGVNGRAGRDGRLGYRISTSVDRSNRFSMPYALDRVDAHLPDDVDPTIAGEGVRVFANLDYNINRNVRAFVEGGSTYMNQTTIAATGIFRDIYPIGSLSYAVAGVQSNWGGLRFFWNNFDVSADQYGDRPFRLSTRWNTYDLEGTFAHGFDTGSVHHDVVAGVGYRRKFVTWTIFDRDFDEDHFQVFLQDSVRLTDRITLVGGVRMDKHPLLDKPVFSPRGALVARIGERQALRASASTAFRTMTFLESYLYTFQPTPVSAVSAGGLGSFETSQRRGAPAIQPEEILSAELGYQNSENERFTFDVAAYFNRVQNIIGFTLDTNPFTLAELQNPELQGLAAFRTETNQFVYGTAGFTNSAARTLVGGAEVVARVYPVDGLDLWANYSFNIAYREGLDGALARFDAAPMHQVNGGVQFRRELSSDLGLDVALDVHYQTSTAFEEQVVGASALEVRSFDLDALYMINGRVGVRLLDDHLSLGVVGYNIGGLWNPGVRQHPLTQQLDARVLGTVGYRF